MVLQFNEAPDYASILERDYEKQNRGFARREQAERANDQRRIQNAGVPLEVITSLIQFSGTAKKMADGIKAQQEERQKNEYLKNPWTSLQRQIAIDKNERGLDITTDDYKARLKVAREINNEGKIVEAIDFVNESTYKKVRYGVLEAQINDDIAKWDSSVAEKMGDITGLSFDQKSDLYQAKISERLNDFNEFPEVLVDKWKQSVDKRKAVFLKDAAIKLKEETELSNDIQRQYQLKGQLTVDDTPTLEKNVLRMIDVLKVEKDINASGAIKIILEDTLKLVEEGSIPASVARKLEAITFLHRGKKGHPREKILEAHSKMLAETGWDKRLTDAQVAVQQFKDTNKVLYQKGIEQNIQDIEDEQGFSMTTTQLAEYLKQNYDPSQGGPIPDALTNRLTKEKADDKELVRQLDHKWDKGIPFSKEEVMKLNDRDLENQWLKKVTETNPNVPPENLTKEANSLIDKYISKHTKETDGRKDKSVKWQNNQINAQRAYKQIYARRIQTAPSTEQAHLDTLKEVEGNINLGLYDQLPTTDPNRAQNREVALIGASKAIALNEDIVNTGIIYGTEDIIKEAQDLPEGQVHFFYQQLGDKIGVNGHVLQYKQLEIAAELKGEGKPVKSKILQEYEKLDATTQELLSRHPSQAKVTRAIVEEYGKDGVIDYNDVGLLIDDVLEDYPVTETVIEGTPQSQMKPSPRTKKRPDDEVAFFDDPQVRQNIKTSVDIAYKTLLPKYAGGQKLVRLLSRDLAKAISDRKKEVEEMNRVNRRKRY